MTDEKIQVKVAKKDENSHKHLENAELAVNYGAAHGALAMTTPGDTTMASLKEVEAIMGGVGARVQR